MGEILPFKRKEDEDDQEIIAFLEQHEDQFEPTEAECVELGWMIFELWNSGENVTQEVVAMMIEDMIECRK